MSRAPEGYRDPATPTHPATIRSAFVNGGRLGTFVGRPEDSARADEIEARHVRERVAR